MEIDQLQLLIKQKAKRFHRKYTPTSEQVRRNRILKNSGHDIKNIRRGNYHIFFQYFLMNYAKEFNLIGIKEYKVKNGRIDVMWQLPNGENFIAFEIDTSNRVKSIKKLLDVEAEHRIWICSAYIVKFEKFKVFGEVTANEIRNGNRVIKCIYI